MKKCVSVVIPTFNEEKNIPLIHGRISSLFSTKLINYDYKILFVDNYSSDNSRNIIRLLAKEDCNVQFIFYIRNFGFSKSSFYGLTQAEGDCAILIFADLQDPPELIVDFLEEWEKGFKVVVGIKKGSSENRIMFKIRGFYYSLMEKITEIEHISQFTGFGLYDKSVLKTFSKIDNPIPYLRGLVAELAPKSRKIFYVQDKRKYGKSSFKFFELYDVAMLGITSYSKVLMRFAFFIGILVSIMSTIIALVTIILKIFNIVNYPIGNAAIIFGIYFLGGITLLFIGILGEYVSNINTRSMHHPLVVEEERYNLKIGAEL